MAYRTKVVQFDFFTPMVAEKDRHGVIHESVLDLGSVLPKLHRNQVYDLGGIEFVLKDVQKDAPSGFWFVQILKIRDASLPGIYDEHDSSYEFITLNDGEKLAESTTIICDAVADLFVMQRNKFAVSIEQCQEFFATAISSAFGRQVGFALKPRQAEDAMSILKRKNRLKKVVLTADTDRIGEIDDSSLAGLLGSFRRYGCKVVKLEISVDRARERELNSDEAIKLLEEAYNFPATKKLCARVAATEDTEFSYMDLLENRKNMLIDVRYDTKQPITHDRLARIFVNEYRGEM